MLSAWPPSETRSATGSRTARQVCDASEWSPQAPQCLRVRAARDRPSRADTKRETAERYARIPRERMRHLTG